MLLAGALADRLSPRFLIIASGSARMLLVTSLAILTMSEGVQLWMLYVFAVAFGSADAFYFPARGALVPRLVPQASLTAGNAALQAGNQLAMVAGPLLAGNVIAILGTWHGGGDPGEVFGIGAAFAVDAATFLVAIVLLARTGRGRSAADRTAREGADDLWSSMIEGIRVVRRDPFLRTTLAFIGAGNLLVTGPLYVGLPVLVQGQYQGGAGSLGLVLSLLGAGSLAGLALAVIGPALSERAFLRVMGSCCGVIGVGLILLGGTDSFSTACTTCVFIGAGQGYLVVRFLTTLQQRTNPQVLGRIMSLLMFMVVGLSPVSSGVAGALMEFNAATLLVVAGIGLMLVVMSALFFPSLRTHGGRTG
jgi:MFS family permease